MRVLIGFEQSQNTTAAFIALGHNAMSCDKFYPGAKGLPHYQGDIFDVLCEQWDLIILHPPCTYTALCGNRYYWNSPLRPEGVKLCVNAWDTARKYSPRVALEQPKTIMQKYIGKRSQVIQPWMFGHLESKETWLWLWGLDPLTETNNVYEEMMKLPKTKRTRIHYMSPGPERQRKRSETYPGVSQAMAAQWGTHA
jgi:hypothetical protein